VPVGLSPGSVGQGGDLDRVMAEDVAQDRDELDTEFGQLVVDRRLPVAAIRDHRLDLQQPSSNADNPRYVNSA
jgi:hypothetical protein